MLFRDALEHASIITLAHDDVIAGTTGNPFRAQAGATSGNSWPSNGTMMIPAPGVTANNGATPYNGAHMDRMNMISTPGLDGVGPRSNGAHPWQHGHGDAGAVQPTQNAIQASFDRFIHRFAHHRSALSQLTPRAFPDSFVGVPRHATGYHVSYTWRLCVILCRHLAWYP